MMMMMMMMMMMTKVKTKMESYFFLANAPKVILCIILFGINAEIRVAAKK
jgi:hypothetical protein